MASSLQTARHADACGVGLGLGQSTGLDLSMVDAARWTAMHYAALQGELELAMWLRAQGVEIEAPDHSGAEPVHYASIQCRIAVVDWLHSQGVPLDTPDAQKKQPIHYACVGDELR